MSEFPGVVVPLLTPLTEDESVDEKGLRSLIDYVIGHGVQGLFALATTGEYLGLLERTQVELVEIVLDANSGCLPVWVGIGDVSTIRVFENMKSLYQPGISAFVVTTPFFYGNLSQGELVSHFLAVADASEVPVFLYNIPQNTHIHLEPQSVLELSRHPNIVGIKDSSGVVSFVQELVSLIGEESAFKVYEGDERVAVDCLHAGAYGIISGLANLVPDVLVALRDACIEKDEIKTSEIHQYIYDMSCRVGRNYWLTGIKAVAEGLGLGSSHPLRPWLAKRFEEDPSLMDMVRDLQEYRSRT